jgi:hypothetical protein
MTLPRFIVILACTLLAGCGSLLPRGSLATPSPFDSYEQARSAAGRIAPFETRQSQLAALGFDPDAGSNVTVIAYPDIVARLAPYSGVPLEALDPGIRQCILARSQCQGLLFRFERQDRRREGGFWSDFFNVRRVTVTRGWWFEALVVVSGGQVLFSSAQGQARLEHTDRQTNPLGPFQPAGEGAGAILLR